MKAVLRLLISTPFLTCFFTAVLSLALWFLGPLLAFGGARPLDGYWERGITLGVIWLLVVAFLVIRWLGSRRRNRELAAEIAAVDPRDEAVAQELKELSAKLKSAMQMLRKSKSGRKQLYDLPWYIMIGPPGAGKTTAIINSGLKFPLAEEGGQKGAIGGVGGTRNCDWWFTEDAILIDTAGRYTTQDSDSEADNVAWLGFLRILKKYRKRQPINGALVAISLSDLSMQDHETQMSHARAIRRRIIELREQLGIRFPVYIVFTKSDLIAGFAEYFESLSKADREQVWGVTFDLDKGKRSPPPLSRFNEEFGLLLSQVNAQMLERLTGELNPERRGQIAAFPSQLASIRPVATEFLGEIFQETKYEDRLLLRGVYFTSGTQEGTPIDRLMMNMARTFGIGRSAIGAGQGTGKSFFITGLFRDVVFREAGLVSVDDAVERSYRWITRGAIAGGVLTAAALAALWTQSFFGNRGLVAAASAAVGGFRAAEIQIPGNPVSDTDLPSIVPALNILRDLPGNPVLDQPEPAWQLGFGLYQGEVIGTGAAQSYRAALNRHLLPRLILRLEEQLQGNMNNPEFLYEGLKVYLMLGLEAPAIEEELVTQWMLTDWELSYPGDARTDLRADLSDHLTALLRQPMEKVELNGPLVEQIRIILAEMSLSERIYKGIISSAEASALPDWRITDIGGPAVARALTRSSGKPLSEGIDGIFTYRGFNEVFLTEALGVASRFQNESWVLGELGESEQSELALAQMSRDVLDLYYNDYVEQYDTMLGDIDIVPLANLAQAVEVTNILSGPTSPIVYILEAVAAETRLTEERGTVPSETTDQVGEVLEQDAINTVRNQRMRQLLGVLAQSRESDTAATPGTYVEDRFSWLHELIAAEGDAPSQLDGIIGQLEEVYRELNRMSLNSTTAAGEEGAAIARLIETVARLPGPLQRWVSQVAAGSSGIAADGNRATISARWQSEVAAFCARALTGRYPFNQQSEQEVTIQDFSTAFKPGGLIDQFFTDNLLRHVDTRANPWTWKEVNQAELGISDAVLTQFQYAAQIRDTFFVGGDVPKISFELTPQALDPKAQSVTLDVDGLSVTYAHGDQITPSALQWPGEFGLGRISFLPPSNVTESTLTREGPWGWLRLLNAAEVRDTEVPEKKRIIFKVGGLIAIFQLRMGSAFNPFTLTALSKFQCPESL